MRPDVDNYFMALAFVASQRSRDESTRHGSCLRNDENQVIGMGYNSFPKGMNDSLMPQERKYKYFAVTHSEINTLINCTTSPKGSTLYVTGRPCSNCLSALINAGIKKIVAADRRGYTNPPSEELEMFNLILSQSKIDYIVMKPDLTWLKEIEL
jgi:dCMP deaminase